MKVNCIKIYSSKRPLTPPLSRLILTLIASEMPFSLLPRPLPLKQYKTQTHVSVYYLGAKCNFTELNKCLNDLGKLWHMTDSVESVIWKSTFFPSMPQKLLLRELKSSCFFLGCLCHYRITDYRIFRRYKTRIKRHRHVTVLNIINTQMSVTGYFRVICQACNQNISKNVRFLPDWRGKIANSFTTRSTQEQPWHQPVSNYGKRKWTKYLLTKRVLQNSEQKWCSALINWLNIQICY